MKLLQAVLLLLSSVAVASTSSDGSDIDIKQIKHRRSSSYLRRGGRDLEGLTPVVDCSTITDEGSCVTTPTTGHFCVWDAGSSTCTLDRPICPLLSPSECRTGRNLQLCMLDTTNDSGCTYASADLWGTDLEASADWQAARRLQLTRLPRLAPLRPPRLVVLWYRLRRDPRHRLRPRQLNLLRNLLRLHQLAPLLHRLRTSPRRRLRVLQATPRL